RVYTRSYWGIRRVDNWNRDAVTSNARKKIDDVIEKAVEEVLAQPEIAGIARRQALALIATEYEGKAERNREEVERLTKEALAHDATVEQIKAAIDADRAEPEWKRQARLNAATQLGKACGERESLNKTWSELFNLERESSKVLTSIAKEPAG